MTITSQKRIELLSKASKDPIFEKYIGALSCEDLQSWLDTELGNSRALDTFLARGDIFSKAIAPKNILHILSGNTPHAAFQSLLAGLVLGSKNTLKLPSPGLPHLCSWVDKLPPELASLVEMHHEMSLEFLNKAQVVVATGSDQTILSIQKEIKPHQIFLAYGHKFSIAVVYADYQEAAKLAARDISLFNQHGCLSPHAIYVEGSLTQAEQFAKCLAQEMKQFAKDNPPEVLSLSEAGAIRTLRETARYKASNGLGTMLWESDASLDWTVILEQNSSLALSPANRCIYVHPLSRSLSKKHLGKQALHLSSIAIHPFDLKIAEKLCELPAQRICQLGQSQQPSLYWRNGGICPLASLVRWKDIG